jgi:uncharacterized protein YjbJ (UPF0337 family)
MEKNTSANTKSWAEIRGEIKKKFSKLSDETLDSLNESFDHLSEKVQHAYGMAKDKADREIEQLKRSVHRGTDELRSDTAAAAKATKENLNAAKKKIQNAGSSRHH